MKKIRGEITVFFTLIMTVILAFINSLLLLASIQNSKSLSKASVDMAVNSVFAEYQEQLLKRYDVFSLDSRYSIGNDSVSNITDRLLYYGATGMDSEIERIRYLTDDNGAAFYEQAIRSCGGDLLSNGQGGYQENDDISTAVDQWQEQLDFSDEYTKSENNAKDMVEDLLVSNELDLGEDNPFRKLQEWKNKEILSLVLPEGKELSNQSVMLSDLASHRSLQKGNGGFSCEFSGRAPERMLFLQYLKKHFACFTSDGMEGTLQYELEYLIAGKASDVENLKAIVDRLLIMRLGANFIYLNTDQEKKAEARAAALAVSTAAGIPALEEPIMQGILAVWAYEESVNDIRSLLGGGKISLLKTKDEWNSPGDSEKGLSYEQYLEIILFLSSLNNERMRALDLIEQNLRYVGGDTDFRVDACVNNLEIHTVSYLDQGFTYEFETGFGYK